MLNKFVLFSLLLFSVSVSLAVDTVISTGTRQNNIVKKKIALNAANDRRVTRGIKGGRRTKDEVKVIMKQENIVRKLKHDAKKDGVITTKERENIKLETDKLNVLLRKTHTGSGNRNK